VLGSFPFNPTVHLNYEETVLPMMDGLPKLKNFPPAIGGSGETLPEPTAVIRGASFMAARTASF
jgi:hypothetical protein